MRQTSSTPLAAGLPADQVAEADSVNIYAPQFVARWAFALVFIGVPLLAIVILSLIILPVWLSGGPVSVAETLPLLMLLGIFIACGLVVLVINLIRGVPKLTVTSRRVTLESSFGSKWADWDSVGSFAIKTVYANPHSQGMKVVSARVTGPNTDRSSRRRKVFRVPDQFRAPPETIVDDLNAARARAVGASDTEDAEPPEAEFGLERFGLPWLTFALLAVLVIIFILENEFAIAPGVGSTPSPATLFALGGLSSKAVISGGQWYRLFTAPLLHASDAHVIGNGMALLICGLFLERLVGRLWFFAIFVLSALGGSLMSLAVGAPDRISIGASGAIMGLFAAALVSSFRLAPGTPERSQIRTGSTLALIPSLLPLSAHIDYGAHIGGALSGAIVVAVLRKFFWPETERIPQLRKVATAVSIAGAVVFVASAGMVIVNYPSYRVAGAKALPAPPPQKPFPAWPPSAAPLAQPDPPVPSSKTGTSSDSTLDHGPGRVACDWQWSKDASQAAHSYPEFLRDCMENSRH